MKEILTDELLDEFYKKYRFYKAICERCDDEPITFEAFVEKRLEFRASKIKELKESGLHVR